MYSVYLIQSISNRDKKYVGYTANFSKRLGEHNDGKVPFTKNHAPWQVCVRVEFKEGKKAKEFERYLKHGSGHAFANKHFW